MNIYHTANNASIYQIRLNVFPGLVGNVYWVVVNDQHYLIDTGSGFGESNQELLDGIAEIGKIRGEKCSADMLSYIFITHGHIDHFGGLSFIHDQSPAKICIHEFDQRIVSNHEERLSLAAHRLEEFLIEAGVGEEQRSKLLEMYKITKSLYRSVNVDLTYEASGMEVGPFQFIHVPGHCAGHVLIKLHDVMFSGDHILEKTSPHQAPEQITLSTGLDTYLKSLLLTKLFSKDIRFILGGHENPVYEIDKRINEILGIHKDRLLQVQGMLVVPHTIAEISKYLFGKVEGYTILLALEEAGAHVEYLYQRGLLEIANLRDIEAVDKLVPIQYRSLDHH